MKEPSDWHHPRCSGLRVQGTAISPTSAALLPAEAGTRLAYILLYFLKISNLFFWWREEKL